VADIKQTYTALWVEERLAAAMGLDSSLR